jgi:hypothetical protein
MQLFLGDEVTLIKELDPIPTYITGQVSGIVLDKHKDVERLYIQGIESAFWMYEGWKFVDMENEEDDGDEI